eukprot:15332924-Ditylum_brightwellii.AAC.1
MALVTKAKRNALFSNARKGEKVRLSLTEMDQSQLPIPITTDNPTVCDGEITSPQDQHIWSANHTAMTSSQSPRRCYWRQ